LRYFFLQAPIPYQSLDETGCLLDVNPAWLETLGYQREEVLGRSFGEFLHPEWTEVFARRFPVFKTVGEILGVEFDMIKKDGAFITVSFSGQIEAGPDGQFRRTHCIFEDITNHKADQAEVRTLRGIIPICAQCKSISDGDGTYHQLETFISQHTEALFTHGLCPDCVREHYPDHGTPSPGKDE